MQFSDLISMVNHLNTSNEVSMYFKALRHDEIIWNGYEQLTAEQENLDLLMEKGQKLDAGSLSLLSIDRGIIFELYPKVSFAGKLLEQIMFEYESYIQSTEPIESFHQASLLAAALMEKRKVASSWKNVIVEILSRMKIASNEKFEQYWRSIFAIVVNLIEEKDEFFADLLSLQQQENGLGIFLHAVLCLPVEDSQKTEFLSSHLHNLNTQCQSQALRLLTESSDSAIVLPVASNLLEKYSKMDLGEQPYENYWNTPASSLQFALQCQAAADIAVFADEPQTAMDLTNKSLEIFTAIQSIGKIKKLNIATDGDALRAEQLFTAPELSRPEISSELVFTKNANQIEVDPEHNVFPVKVLQRSREISVAGNSELASHDISETLGKLTNQEFEDVFLKGPRFSNSWDVVSVLESLIDSNAFQEAGRAAQILVHRNPTNIRISLAAAKAFEACGNHSAALKTWRSLEVLDPNSEVIKRKLAAACNLTGNTTEAFEIMQKLVEQAEMVNIDDLIKLAALAYELDENREVISATAKILEQNPDHAEALTLSGLAHYKMGELESAIEQFEKSIENPGEDPRSWITLSEIYWQNGNKESALNILKSGIAANPDQRSLQAAYVKGLMQIGSTAEAYPILRELSKTEVDREIDFLYISAMKQLGIEEIGIVLEDMKMRYPFDSKVLADYGQYLIENGKLVEGYTLLSEVEDELASNPDYALAFVEGLLNVDYSNLRVIQNHSNKELNKSLGYIGNVLVDQPEDVRAAILKGELLMRIHRYDEAFGLFGNVLEMNRSLGNSPLARVHADLASTAIELGKTEIALASIEESIDLQPDWVGLHQVKTEILLKSREIRKAEAQLNHMLDICPESIEKVTWTANVMHLLGKTNESEQILRKGMVEFPENLELLLQLAELNFETGATKLPSDLNLSIIQRSNTSHNPSELIQAAVIWSKTGESEQVISTLSRACELGSKDAAINLAAYYRQNNDYENSITSLNSVITSDEEIILFRAEIEFEKGNRDSAYELLESATDQPSDLEIDPAFLPANWSEFVYSNKPATVLALIFNLKSGKHVDSMTRVKGWIEAEPSNIEARIYAIENALACNSLEDYITFLDYSGEEKTDFIFRHFKMLQIEHDQDNSVFALSAEEPSTAKVEMKNDPLGTTWVRSLAAEGQLWDAETRLIEAITGFVEGKYSPYIIRVGQLRNLIKASVAVNRWKEAIELIRQYGSEMAHNDEMNSLFLRTIVEGTEFFTDVQDLSVEHHLPWSELLTANLQNEIETLAEKIGKNREKDSKHWMLRGNLALNPDQQNIRALALIKPDAGDAAAMMKGLRATDQVSTAIQVAKKFANEPRVLSELANCYVEKEPEKAIEVLNKSLSILPDQPLVFCRLSKLELMLSRNKEAHESMESAIYLWPNESQWHIKAAEILATLGNLDAPIDHLIAALDLDSENPDTLFLLGKAYLSNRNAASALEYLQAAAEHRPNQAQIWEAISEAYELSGDLSQSLEAAEIASQADPFAVKPHLQAGKVNWSKGELEKALDQVRAAISLDPEEAESYVFLARLLVDRGEKGKALETLEKASKCKTANVSTIIEQATLVKEINGNAAARDLLEAFSQRFPENADLLKLLAEAEEECGDLKKAEIAAKRALDMHPNETDLHLFLGKLQEKNGNLDQAAHYFSQAIAHDPADSEGYIKLSQAFSKQREYAKAREVLEEGLRRTPEDVNLYMACAAMLKEAKDYHGAEQMLRKASIIDPRNLVVHRQLGAVLALNLVHQSQEVSSHL